MTIFDTIIQSEPINKGWSEDKKYCVTVAGGTKYLLRITPIQRYETRKALFDMLGQVAALGIPMCKPVEFGTCKGGVYSLQTWINGQDAEEIIPLLPETEQYVLGLKSGEILRKIHTIPAPVMQEDWAIRFNRKTNYKIQKYFECGLRFDGDGKVIEYIENNRHLLENRPQCFQHGDYHIGNMMIENGEIVIIDFDRFDYGDPWEEFNRIVFCAQKSPHFATGMVKGYFDGKPSLEFWRLLAFYIWSNLLSMIYWAVPYGQNELNTSMNLVQDALAWYDNMQNPVPAWYMADFYFQYTDGVPYKLKATFDFSFLRKYGTVFKVYDDQDSGNICFGMTDGDKRYFVKFAGAPTERGCVIAEETIANLKRTVPIYRDLAHPTLIKLISAEEIGSGFAVIFNWVDAECMHRMYPLSRKKFLQMPLESKLQVFDEILSFHAHVAKQGNVAIDFYDGSIMYDFNNARAIICDIDFYSKMPYTNTMGRLWGSSRFMSPEEFEFGAIIDEVTNVYTMGATAFALFGGEQDRNFDKWTLSKTLYDVAKQAVSDDRNGRQQSIEQLMSEWYKAKVVSI